MAARQNRQDFRPRDDSSADGPQKRGTPSVKSLLGEFRSKAGLPLSSCHWPLICRNEELEVVDGLIGVKVSRARTEAHSREGVIGSGNGIGDDDFRAVDRH